MSEITKIVAVAKAERGYLEKRSNKYLDHKTKNAGFNNYTKYNRDMMKIRHAGTLTDYWCANTVCWVFIKALGKKRAQELLHVFTGYVPYSYNAFKKDKRIYKQPKVGDVAFFKNNSHTGIVVGVNGSYVAIFEGNTGNGATNNGGCTKIKKYNWRTSSWVKDFGRPRYKTTPKRPLLKKGDKNAYVLKAKKLLAKKGYKDLLNLKSKTFGDGTLKAVKAFQKKSKLKVDGEIGPKTWAALLK